MKNSANRISLKFSEENPEQKQAFDILKGKGRRKTIFVAEAIAFYEKYKDKMEKQSSQLSKEEIKTLIREVLSEMSPEELAALNLDNNKAGKNNKDKKPSQEEIIDAAASAEGIDDFLDNLDMF